MSSIGRTHHLRCRAILCRKRRPYWSDYCAEHRKLSDDEMSERDKKVTAEHRKKILG